LQPQSCAGRKKNKSCCKFSVTLSEKNINVISFDVPYPPDYGGVIDVFYKIKSLHGLGVKVHLHCFEYGRKSAGELNSICASINYYSRRTSKSQLFNTYPYIVLSRDSEELKKNLKENNFPILMEGLHSTRLLGDPAFTKRKMFVRTHNVEHNYYENLAKVEGNIFKRYYFYNEAGKLLKYEPVLKNATAILAISPNDTDYFSSRYKHVHYVTAFHPHESVTGNPGKGDYAFYHGNLSVGENNEAALYLVNKVFDDLDTPLIIAGSKPSDELKKAVRGKMNVTLLDDLGPDQIQEYISEAHCNILPTFQSTGIKLKLLSALFAGRFCIVNKPMVENTGLESLCIMANTPEAMKEKIKSVFGKEFTLKERKKREEILMKDFSNEQNGKKLLKILNG
jgi:glycosyltransferase involved in cell wall biosynthesis